jgi:Zn-finger nucleic acid-binding protein
MANEKDRFGEKMRLVERAKEDIYFAAKDRELIEKLKARLEKISQRGKEPLCPRCDVSVEGFSLLEIQLDRCSKCGGIWFDRGELEQILRKIPRSPIVALVDRLLGPHRESEKKAQRT